MAKVIPITTENFQSELMREAESRPVVMTFASSQMPECKAFNADLEALSSELDFTLGTVSLDDPNNMAFFVQMFRIQDLPFAVVLSKGDIADAIQEPLSKDDLKKRLAAFFVSDEERAKLALEEAVSNGNFAEAKAAIVQELQKKPDDDHLKILLSKCELGQGNADAAKEILLGISPNSEEHGNAKTLLDLMDLLVEAAKTDLVAGDSLSFRKACQFAEKKDYKSALEILLNLAVSNPDFRNGIAKKAMIVLFGVLGPKNPLTWEYRGKLNTMLFI